MTFFVVVFCIELLTYSFSIQLEMTVLCCVGVL